MLSTLLACFLVWVLYLWLDRQRLRQAVRVPVSERAENRRSARQYRKISKRPQFANSKAVNQPQDASRRVAPRTENQLYSLVHGDMKLAKRLVENSRSRYPNQSEQWLYEKVIYDLQRDHN